MPSLINILTKIFLFAFFISHSIDPIAGNPHQMSMLMMKSSTKLSPEIVNELKDFENLIPPAKIDAIVAEHFLVDGNFRKALKFVRSSECNHMLSQLLDMPEIVEVLEFLHLTVNTTGEENGGAYAASNAFLASSSSSLSSSSSSSWSQSPVVNDNEMKKVTTNAKTTGSSEDFENGGGGIASTAFFMHSSAIELAARKALVYKTQQMEKLENSMEMNNALPIVDIIQLEEGRKNNNDDDEEKEEEATSYNASDEDDDDFRLMFHHMKHPVGTFTSFVEEVMEQLPHTAYQNMIIEKCKKKANFAEFYKALRSPALKPLVDQAMKTINVAKIISTFNENDIDAKALEPIAFKVISWGPNLNEI